MTVLIKEPNWVGYTSFRFTYTRNVAPTYIIGEYAKVRKGFTHLVEELNVKHCITDPFKFLTTLVTLSESSDENIADKATRLSKQLFIDAGYTLYQEILEKHDPEELSFLLWKRFNSDCDWHVVRMTFRDMPTNIFEHFMNTEWETRKRTINIYEIEDMFLQRTDEYKLPGEIMNAIFSN